MSGLRRLLPPLGVLLTLACLVYFGRSLWRLDPERLLALPVDGLAVALGLSVAIYAGLLVAVSLGFAHLLKATGHASARPVEGVIVWGRANLAKYLPGNVFHFAGRQVLGARYGWPQPKIAAATLLELALQVVLPCTLAVGALLAVGQLAMLGEQLWLLPLVLGLGVVLLFVLFGGLARRWLPAPAARLAARCHLAQPLEIVPAAIYQTAFFIGMTLVAAALYALVDGALYQQQLPYLFAAFLISWVLGLVVPGAPGGIGVREGSFALLGSAFLSWDSLVLVALLMRLVTTAGEGALVLIAGGLAWGEKAAAAARQAESGAVPRAAPAPSPAWRSSAADHAISPARQALARSGLARQPLSSRTPMLPMLHLGHNGSQTALAGTRQVADEPVHT